MAISVSLKLYQKCPSSLFRKKLKAIQFTVFDIWRHQFMSSMLYATKNGLKQLYNWWICKNGLIIRCLPPFSTFFQLYRGGQSTHSCFPGVLFSFISNRHNTLSKPVKNMITLVRSPALPSFFPRIDDGHCDRVHSSLTTVRCFDNRYVGKQPVAWKEYCARYTYWLKEVQNSNDICTGLRNLTEILFKTASNTIQSINQSKPVKRRPTHVYLVCVLAPQNFQPSSAKFVSDN